MTTYILGDDDYEVSNYQFWIVWTYYQFIRSFQDETSDSDNESNTEMSDKNIGSPADESLEVESILDSSIQFKIDRSRSVPPKSSESMIEASCSRPVTMPPLKSQIPKTSKSLVFRKFEDVEEFTG